MNTETSPTTPQNGATTSLQINVRRLTKSEKALMLATRAHVCERSARYWLKGRHIAHSAGERLAFAAKELGIVRDCDVTDAKRAA